MTASAAAAQVSPAGIREGWIRPAGPAPREPRWGHPDGMQLGLSPAPRGLLQIFTPYLDHPRDRLVNFIAVEPVPVGAVDRGYSELEPSTLDPGERGKRMWAVDDPDTSAVRARLDPDPGIVDTVDGVERLTTWVRVERFDSGADVQVRVRFRADRPHEVELAGFATSRSVPLEQLVLTATMGNWARLRRLELADSVATPSELWPGFTGTDFAEHASFGLDELVRDGDAVLVTALGDEADPWSVGYAQDTAEHWRFVGRRMRQTWRVDDPDPALRAQVNARWSYWASASEIPGGPAFENVEVVQPFRQGAVLRFVVEPLD
jgi:hypothetical protein